CKSDNHSVHTPFNDTAGLSALYQWMSLFDKPVLSAGQSPVLCSGFFLLLSSYNKPKIDRNVVIHGKDDDLYFSFGRR
ncbi:MAG: hypothetical protein IJ242_00450, partial [Clostridia bacterium]|nr:hypothetical protein [Clostridia bacterium]